MIPTSDQWLLQVILALLFDAQLFAFAVELSRLDLAVNSPDV